MPMLAASVRRTSTPDGGVVLNIEHGEMFSLNATGSKILDLLSTGLDEQEIARQLSEATGASVDIVRVDLREFLETLARHGILQSAGERSGRRGGSR